ncbi:hypothetical protein K474DRAFT_1711207 [Panus rudis PR-1116 ss-1]|nr:hypothetical protein K474DRAFT_1711207 [Panus rudis PR-1116 ss-1]
MSGVLLSEVASFRPVNQLQDARAFIQVKAETCQLTNPYGVVKGISLKSAEKPSEPSAQGGNTEGVAEMQVDPDFLHLE